MRSDNITGSTNGQPQGALTYIPEVHHDIFPSGRSFVNWLAVGTLGFLALLLSLTAIYFVRPELKEGDIVERTILAAEDGLVEDREATLRAREQAKRDIIPVFKLDTGQKERVLSKLNEKLELVKALHSSGFSQAEGKSAFDVPSHFALITKSDAEFHALEATLKDKGDYANQVRAYRHIWQRFKQQHPSISDDLALVALLVPPQSFSAFEPAFMASARRTVSGFKRFSSEAKTDWVPLVLEFMPESWTSPVRTHAARLIVEALEPNVIVDEAATQVQSEKTAASIGPVMRKMAKGETLFAKGTQLTASDVDLLKSVGVTQTNRWPIIIGLSLSVAAAIALSAGFLYTFEPRFLFQTSSIALMYTVSIVVCTAASWIGRSYPEFIPLPAAALVWTVFFGRRVSCALTIPLVIILAVAQIADSQHLFALGTASGAAIGGYTKRRNSLMLTGIIMGVMQAMGFLMAATFSQNADWDHMGKLLGFELFAGVVSAMLALGSLPFLESIFGLITPMRLAEITDADQPLLRQLEENAPGTYQHSLAVANLAEAGARAISSDVNLVRAGALYHDIGKMARPKYFIENQLGAKNPHDSIEPEESRERVLAHVTDGLELAKKYRLPKAVQDFIPMHQGTSLMAYFYHKACVRDGIDKVDPSFYRYPGPKPQSKETAIVMLADVSEAVTHSMHDPSEEEVESAMAKVFQNRWDDGQFTETGLTYGELNKIKDAFVRVWRTLHHERLKYPSTTTGRMPIPPENAQPVPDCCAADVEVARLPSAEETQTSAAVAETPSTLSETQASAASGETQPSAMLPQQN
ncbi:MAG TPA: HDIG domain-containing metalloprotein [Candidatus Obscuribacterales bacterium]